MKETSLYTGKTDASVSENLCVIDAQKKLMPFKDLQVPRTPPKKVPFAQ